MNHNEGIVNTGSINSGAMAAGRGAHAEYHTSVEQEPEAADDHPDTPETAVHRTILAVDVEGFGDQRRRNPHQIAVREGLYRALHRSCAGSSIPWEDCYREDRGDGLFLLAPPKVPKNAFVTSFPHELVAALSEHNAVHAQQARIRLRAALHAGEVHFDRAGVAGDALNRAFRLLESAELKSTLARRESPAALIASDWFFEEVIRHSAAAAPDSYRQVQVQVKETSVPAWIR